MAACFCFSPVYGPRKHFAASYNCRTRKSLKLLQTWGILLNFPPFFSSTSHNNFLTKSSTHLLILLGPIWLERRRHAFNQIQLSESRQKHCNRYKGWPMSLSILSHSDCYGLLFLIVQIFYSCSKVPKGLISVSSKNWYFIQVQKCKICVDTADA